MAKEVGISPGGTIRYGITFCLILAAWNFFRSYLLLLMLALMVCGAAVSFLLLWGGRGGVWAEVLLPAGPVGKTVQFPFSVRVHNSHRLAAYTADLTYSWHNLFTGASGRETRHLWVAPSSGGGIGQSMGSSFAGRVEVRLERLAVYDLLHLFCLRQCERRDADVIVWPRTAENEEEKVSDCVEGFPGENELPKRGVDYNPDYEVREYQPGDELKNIHWKLSAKQRELMVRQRLSTGRDVMKVLLPLGESREQNDGLMDAGYGLCRALLREEYPIRLYWPGSAGRLRQCYVAEEGDLDRAVSEILSNSGIRGRDDVREQTAGEELNGGYIEVRTGAYRGAYIR